MAHPGGRPLLFKSVEELQEKIDAYFADCDSHPEEVIVYEWHQKETKRKIAGKMKTVKIDDHSKPPIPKKQWRVSEPKPYTITGLALALGCSRPTLINYESDEQFFATIKAAKDKVEKYWELMLIGSNAAGIIFNLKNNYGWKDKTEQELTNPDGSLSPYKQLTPEQLRKLAEDNTK